MNPNSIQAQALVTFLTPFLIQLAKRSRSSAFAWIDQHKPKICMLTSAAAALTTSMGIDFVHAPHSLTVSWADNATLVHGLLAYLVSAGLQFATQHALYDGFWRVLVPSDAARDTGHDVRAIDTVHASTAAGPKTLVPVP